MVGGHPAHVHVDHGVPAGPYPRDGPGREAGRGRPPRLSRVEVVDHHPVGVDVGSLGGVGQPTWCSHVTTRWTCPPGSSTGDLSAASLAVHVENAAATGVACGAHGDPTAVGVGVAAGYRYRAAIGSAGAGNGQRVITIGSRFGISGPRDGKRSRRNAGPRDSYQL